ncbi:hypothetical protein E3N88_21353 [Mikania micrantha]|uniref:SWIM-type domain-containing protein n=1 Tax=Mikania micrantha TaxID=192012 RepID=A0A5N6NL68_9ASTR|nr:hypothetical protein E3N88_21353 [Mikania micrantha]
MNNSTNIEFISGMEVDDDDISFLNQTMNDSFLSLLCYGTIDDYKEEDEVNSIEDWSSNEKDDDSDGVEKITEHGVVYPSYGSTVNWKLQKPMVGMKFESLAQLKESLIDYGVSNGYQLEFPVNDHKRLLVRCGKETEEDDGAGKKRKVRKCPFRLWASRMTSEDSFQIKSLDEKHICSRKFSLGSLVTYSWIAKRYFKQIIDNPEISLREMQKDVMRKKVIGLDGCFLKNSGQLLSAVGRDANNHIFPLAWAVVSVENKENWMWFLDLLRDDIEIKDGFGLTLISDQLKGIIEAVKDVFPYAEHRQCTRHIYANFKKKYRGLQFKNLFWAAAKSTTEQQFEEKIEELKTISNGAYNHLMERNPITWSRAFFEVNRACDAYENGMSESFNSRIRVARRMPIITMLEEIRLFVMQRVFLMATKAEKMEYDVCPTIRKKLEDIKVKQRHWKVIPSSNIKFEIRNEKDAYVVNIDEQTCSCRSWQLSGIPCVHTVAALVFINKDPETYVSNWLKKDMFKETYKYPIKPLRGSKYWPKTNDIKPLPPKERRMPVSKMK